MTEPTMPPPMFPMGRLIQENLAELRANWFWFVLLGIALIVLGGVALVYSYLAAVAAMLVLGSLLLLGGGFYLVGAFFCRGWGGFFVSLLTGVLQLVLGFIIVDHPGRAVEVYTLLLAMLFLVQGVFRVAAAVTGQFRHWGYMLVTGLIGILLGVMIWKQWPYSGLWVIGTFIGVDLIFSGVSYLMLGLHAKRLPA